MKSIRDNRKKQIKQIAKDFTNLTALAISSPDLDLDKLKNSINKLQDLIAIKIASIEQADRNQGLFSDRSDAQNNSYLGAPSEDFITFEKASKDNGISKTDQLEKLREALTGNATSYIPPANIDSVDSVWTILEKVYEPINPPQLLAGHN